MDSITGNRILKQTLALHQEKDGLVMGLDGSTVLEATLLWLKGHFHLNHI